MSRYDQAPAARSLNVVCFDAITLWHFDAARAGAVHSIKSGPHHARPDRIQADATTSASGHKRTFPPTRAMSAVSPKAASLPCGCHRKNCVKSVFICVSHLNTKLRIQRYGNHKRRSHNVAQQWEGWYSCIFAQAKPDPQAHAMASNATNVASRRSCQNGRNMSMNAAYVTSGNARPAAPHLRRPLPLRSTRRRSPLVRLRPPAPVSLAQ